MLKGNSSSLARAAALLEHEQGLDPKFPGSGLTQGPEHTTGRGRRAWRGFRAQDSGVTAVILCSPGSMESLTQKWDPGQHSPCGCFRLFQTGSLMESRTTGWDAAKERIWDDGSSWHTPHFLSGQRGDGAPWNSQHKNGIQHNPFLLIPRTSLDPSASSKLAHSWKAAEEQVGMEPKDHGKDCNQTIFKIPLTPDHSRIPPAIP